MGQGEFDKILNRLDDTFSEFVIGLGFHFPRTEARLAAADYVRGLISKVERKNSWQLAEATGHKTPELFQHLLNRAVWDQDALRDEHLRETFERLGPEGTLSIDETGFVKKGTKFLYWDSFALDSGVRGKLETDA
jgi:SRSO17 transposase